MQNFNPKDVTKKLEKTVRTAKTGNKEAQKELINTFEEAVDNRDTIICALKEQMKTSHEMLSNIVIAYSNLSSRFSADLNKPMLDLENKSEDIFYVKEFMETYKSILADASDLLQRMTLVSKSSLKIQQSIED